MAEDGERQDEGLSAFHCPSLSPSLSPSSLSFLPPPSFLPQPSCLAFQPQGRCGMCGGRVSWSLSAACAREGRREAERRGKEACYLDEL